MTAALPECLDLNATVKTMGEISGPTPYVSVAYLTRNGGELLRTSLEAVRSQQTDFSFEVTAVDSGSTDGTLEMLREFSVSVTRIPPSDFNFGRTRDLSFRKARGEIVVVISQDAIPKGSDWLARLVAPFSEQSVALVQGRDIPNPAIDLFFWDKICLFYHTRDVKKWMKAYGNIGVSFTCCAVRRSVWEANQLGSIEMSEDKVFQKSIVEKGFGIISLPSVEDYHSHSYDLNELAKRCHNEGLGWRLVGLHYSVLDLVADLLNPVLWGGLLYGMVTLQIRSLSELLFPLIRPYCIFKGNKSASGYLR